MKDLLEGTKVYDKNGRTVAGSKVYSDIGVITYVENGVIMCHERTCNKNTKVKVYEEDGKKIYEQFGVKHYEQNGTIYREYNYVSVYRCIRETTSFLRVNRGIKSITFEVGKEYYGALGCGFMFYLEHPNGCLSMFTRTKMNTYFEDTDKRYDKKYMVDLGSTPSYK